MDELAEKAQKDPIIFRLEHLQDERAKDVVRKIREMTKDQKINENEGLGYGFSRYKNTAAYCAVAAKVLVEKDTGEVHLQQMWSSIDAGEVINIDGIKNQTEGGMIQAASWTLKEEVIFDADHITSRDWASYPILRFNNIPRVEVEVINRPLENALGAGEAAQGPAAAAVANAIYYASGKRVRELPILPRKLKS
ncbi:hypothetical protein BH23BAC1_BH23BAC1_09970 [soil metagenome]